MKELTRQEIEDVFCDFVRLTSRGYDKNQAKDKIRADYNCTDEDIDAAIEATFIKLSKEVDETGDFTLPVGLYPRIPL